MSLTSRAFAAILLLVPLAFGTQTQRDCAPDSQRNSRQFSLQLLRKLSEFSPDPCGPPYGREKDWQSSDIESRFFEHAADVVADGLNGGSTKSPRERAVEALSGLEQMSAEINADWPEEARFHSEIVDLPPALVVRVRIRTDERYFVFGVPQESFAKANRLWEEVGSSQTSLERDTPRSWVELFALRRGPSGNSRFLAKLGDTGCAGGSGVLYEAFEWDPQDSGHLRQIIKQAGSFGMDDNVPGFPVIGKLRTDGARISLPYCWFSVIDTWDNPSLCALDTYDVSGDIVRFRSRVFNRPDLLPIAKAIEYAQQRDYRAVLGYAASAEMARKLVRDVPPHIFAEDLRVIRRGKGRERIEFGGYRYDVERSGSRWLVVSFGKQ